MTKKKPGPAAESLKIGGNWKDAVAKAVHKTKPPEGWPKPDPMPQRAKKAQPTKRKKKVE